MAKLQTRSWQDPWFRWSIVSVVVLSVLTVLVGFVWLPSVQADFGGGGLGASIGGGGGVPSGWDSAAGGPTPSRQATGVVWERAMAKPADAAAVGRGATLAL